MNHQTHETMPGWAEKAGACGSRHRQKEKTASTRNSEYIAAIIFNLIFLWIVNKIPDWHLGFIKESYMVVLWILNVNILIQIAGNALMLLTGLRSIRYLSRMIIEVAGFVTALTLFYIYPFDFSNFNDLQWMDRVLPVFLIIGIVVSGIKAVSNLWKLIFWRD